ncbi:lyase family protein [Nocardioides cheoyonin]|uniref:lyase family protein n=1 Tax=Nocardioides cheoyonin TaxID=3156615 RepID=UPI0032B4AE95
MDLLWPGDERAGDLFSDGAFVAAMVQVEDAWLAAIADAGIAPGGARAPLGGLVGEADVDDLARGAEAGGNPVIGLVALLRQRVGGEASTWVHRGLTSQDVLDTALVLCLGDVLERIDDELGRQAAALVRLARRHRGTVMAGRTLTQHAVPTTFGLKAAGWLSGLTHAVEGVRRSRTSLPAQLGGAAGTLAAVVELARLRGLADPVSAARSAASAAAEDLELVACAPWHTDRSHLTGAADALVGCSDAWGHVAGDVALLARPEFGELAEPTVEGRGGSSTMPQKSNPVLSLLVRRHALAAPPLAASLHTAAAAYVDERPDGAWHTEWATLRTLARRSVVAASQTTELLQGLQVDADRMRTTAEAAGEALHAEQAGLAKLVGGAAVPPDDDYLGANDALIDDAISRASARWKELL